MSASRLGESFTEWEMVQGDTCVVACNNRGELMHYVWQYIEDGDLEVWEVKRTLVQTFTKPKEEQSK